MFHNATSVIEDTLEIKSQTGMRLHEAQHEAQGECTLPLAVTKTKSHHGRFAISVPARSLFLFDLI